jgi:hypothetical protein
VPGAQIHSPDTEPHPPGLRAASAHPPLGPSSPASRSRRNARRALLALSAIAAAEVIGSVGFHVIEGASWINAFYFESMLATGQGPPFPLNTDAGKIFASVMAFVSVGSTLSAVLFILGPMLARLWRGLVEGVETEARRIERDVTEEVHRVRQDRE